jgi:hypothetical protein
MAPSRTSLHFGHEQGSGYAFSDDVDDADRKPFLFDLSGD